MKNVRLLTPRRSWRKKIGPLELSLINAAAARSAATAGRADGGKRHVDDTFDHQRPTIAHTGVCGDVLIAIEFLGARAGGLQTKNIGCEAHDHAVLFAESRDLRGMFVERAQRQVNRNFVNNVAAQKLSQPCVIAAQFETGLFERISAGPIFVHETEKFVAAFRGGLNFPRELNSARVCAQNQHVAEVAAVPPNHREPVLQREPRNDYRKGADHPEHQEELRSDHPD